MRFYCLLTGLFLTIGSACAQKVITKRDITGQLKEQYDKAHSLSFSERYDEALKHVYAAIRIDSGFIDGHILLGSIFYDTGKYDEAILSYKKALSLSAAYQPRVWYQLAMCEMRKELYEEAARHFDNFIKIEPENANLKERATGHLVTSKFRAYALANPVPFNPSRLSDSVNSNNPEYLPTLTVDGENLLFTRIVNGREDFYYSKKRPGGGWGMAVPLAGVNTAQNEGAQTVSADGRTLAMTACERENSLGSCDIYLASMENGKWKPASNIGAPVNSIFWDSQPSLSSDGKTLYFSSNRRGGAGGKDIWVAYKDSKGRWSTPLNLGKIINTNGDEQSPFIHPDGKTLYFMSDGHPGMGGSDIFFSRKNKEGTWSKPQNLGYPINTKANEGALFVSLDGATAYFNSDQLDTEKRDRAWKRNSDLFSFDLHEAARPLPVTYVKAVVKDALTKQPLQVALSMLDVAADSVLIEAQTTEDGSFLACLPVGDNYSLYLSKPGYFFHSEFFELKELSSVKEPFLLEIEMYPIVSEKTDGDKVKPIVLKNVFFETGSAVLLPESKTELDKLKKLLEENPALGIKINGHTDNVGAETDNQVLSEARAKAVQDYLAQNGIDPSRLSHAGYGESQPVSDNETPEGRRQNRRTEFVVIE